VVTFIWTLSAFTSELNTEKKRFIEWQTFFWWLEVYTTLNDTFVTTQRCRQRWRQWQIWATRSRYNYNENKWCSMRSVCARSVVSKRYSYFVTCETESCAKSGSGANISENERTFAAKLHHVTISITYLDTTVVATWRDRLGLVASFYNQTMKTSSKCLTSGWLRLLLRTFRWQMTWFGYCYHTRISCYLVCIRNLLPALFVKLDKLLQDWIHYYDVRLWHCIASIVNPRSADN